MGEMPKELRRQQLIEKVAAAQERNTRRFAERAAKARYDVGGFVAAHPFSSLAGAIATGILIGALLPKAGRRKLGRKASAVATVAADLGVRYAQHAWRSAREAGRSGQKHASQLGEAVVDRTAGLRHEVGRIAEEAAVNARQAGRAVGERAAGAVQAIESRVRS